MKQPYLSYVGLSGVDTAQSLLKMGCQSRSHGYEVVNNIYTAYAGSNIAIRGGVHKPGRDVRDDDVRRMLTLQSFLHFFHYSPLDEQDCFEGPMRLMLRLGLADGVQISQIMAPEGSAWARHLSKLRVFITELYGRPFSVVLQLGRPLLYGSNGLGANGRVDPELLCSWLNPFVAGDAITHVLWDTSGGTGECLDIENARECLVRVQDSFPEIGCGVSGGLRQGMLHSLHDLARQIEGLSVDAASGLRNVSDDSFSFTSARDFVDEARFVLTKRPFVRRYVA